MNSNPYEQPCTNCGTLTIVYFEHWPWCCDCEEKYPDKMWALLDNLETKKESQK